MSITLEFHRTGISVSVPTSIFIRIEFYGISLKFRPIPTDSTLFLREVFPDGLVDISSTKNDIGHSLSSISSKADEALSQIQAVHAIADQHRILTPLFFKDKIIIVGPIVVGP